MRCREDVQRMIQERNEEYEVQLQASKEANRIARGLVPPPEPWAGAR